MRKQQHIFFDTRAGKAILGLWCETAKMINSKIDDESM